MASPLSVFVFASLAAVSAVLVSPAQARDITDMAGRKISVPDRIANSIAANGGNPHCAAK